MSKRKTVKILKTKSEIKLMARSGQINARVLETVLGKVADGVSTLELDSLVESEIRKKGGKPSFKGFLGYGFASCINVNEGVVHGVPSAGVILRNGDIVSIDVGVKIDSLHTDASWTVVVGDSPDNKEKRAFLNAGVLALDSAIQKCVVGNTIGDISYAMQNKIESQGCSVVRDLVGHGVGYSLHEPPQVPCFGNRGKGEVIKEGLTLAIEVMYARGSGQIETAEDGWTIKTKDGSLAAIFEHTVAATKNGPLVLTIK